MMMGEEGMYFLKSTVFPRAALVDAAYLYPLG